MTTTQQALPTPNWFFRAVGWKSVFMIPTFVLLMTFSSGAVMQSGGPWGGTVTEAFFHGSQRAAPGSKEAEVLRGWARALGGFEKLRQIENIYIRGRVETGGLSGLFEEWRVASGQHKQNIELGEAYRQLTVFNGRLGWIVDQNGSVQELKGADLENEITAAYLASFSHFFPNRLAGRAEYLIDDETSQADVLKIFPQSGRPVSFYIDKATHLPLKLERRDTDRIRTTYFSDWREVDGLKMPYQLRQALGDSTHDLA